MPTLSNYNRILDSIAFASTSQIIVSFEGQLEVVFIHEEESYEYLSKRNLKVGYKQPQKSRLYLLNRGVAVEPNGSVLSEENLPTLGYWSWELVAESLPIDYDPEEDKKVLKRTKEEVK